mmetsp:Transcript_31574/g.57384  ORF Transcript_31574/g.57384 Transcript_31574/m.57384 type:complete len:591 (+) Transcript_31574:1-1773(+)
MPVTVSLELQVAGPLGGRRQRRHPPRANSGSLAAATMMTGGRKAWKIHKMEEERLQAAASEPQLLRRGVKLPQLSPSEKNSSLKMQSSSASFHSADRTADKWLNPGLQEQRTLIASDAPVTEFYLRRFHSEDHLISFADEPRKDALGITSPKGAKSGWRKSNGAGKAGKQSAEALSPLEPSQPSELWRREKEAAMSGLQELKMSGKARPAQLRALKEQVELYSFLEETGPEQGLKALAQAFVFKMGSVEKAFQYLNKNGIGTLSFCEFAIGVNIMSFDLIVLCGKDERHTFRRLGVDVSGSINLRELIRLGEGREMSKEVRVASSKAVKSPKAARGFDVPSSLSKSRQDLELSGQPVSGAPRATSEAANSGGDVSEAVDMAQIKWVCVSKWLAATSLGSAVLHNERRNSGWQRFSEETPTVSLMPVEAALDIASAAPGAGTAASSSEEAASVAPASPLAQEAKEANSAENEGVAIVEAVTAAAGHGQTFAPAARLQALFNSAATTTAEDGTKIMDLNALKAFFGDLVHVDPKWHKQLDRSSLNKYYNEAVELQVDLTKISTGLTFWSFKVVLHKMLRSVGEGWMSFMGKR